MNRFMTRYEETVTPLDYLHPTCYGIGAATNERQRNKMRNHLHFEISVGMFDERIRWEDQFFATVRKEN